MSVTEPTHGVHLTDDLIFASRVTGTARDLGFRVQSARSLPDLERLVGTLQPTCLIVDLAFPGLRVDALVASLGRAARVVAYGSHVDTATLQAARRAGCDPVLPRSKFVEVLPTELAAWLSPT